MVVVEGAECPKSCKNGGGIVWEGEMTGGTCPGYISRGNVRMPYGLHTFTAEQLIAKAWRVRNTTCLMPIRVRQNAMYY